VRESGSSNSLISVSSSANISAKLRALGFSSVLQSVKSQFRWGTEQVDVIKQSFWLTGKVDDIAKIS
jgi:hypothetical protein